EDFLSAEIQAVPVHPAKDVGLDRSMIGSYGQDDRVCAFTSLMASINVENPMYTTVSILADKEEIGSTGNTGLESYFLKYFIDDLADMYGVKGRDVLSVSKCLSADVSAAFDPNYADVYEKNNSAYLNYGTSIMKYTGSRGKGGTSDASAEFMGEIRTMLNENNIAWQSCELGKIDAGGGGTVAMYIAKFNVDVIDIGVPVISMHSPFEIVSKLDVYMTYKACEAFFSK
ncbi:MAG: aminopeptidase, partial [Oscillospiraceae bacterium]